MSEIKYLGKNVPYLYDVDTMEEHLPIEEWEALRNSFVDDGYYAIINELGTWYTKLNKIGDVIVETRCIRYDGEGIPSLSW